MIKLIGKIKVKMDNDLCHCLVSIPAIASIQLTAYCEA